MQEQQFVRYEQAPDREVTKFNREVGDLSDIARHTKPATVRVGSGFTGQIGVWIAQTFRNDDGFRVALEVIAEDGRATRLIIPPKVCERIYRQREALTDRSTPESRKRKAAARARAKARKEKAERKAKYAARNS
jgi:hypothetical protein